MESWETVSHFICAKKDRAHYELKWGPFEMLVVTQGPNYWHRVATVCPETVCPLVSPRILLGKGFVQGWRTEGS
jgi:hypothetical protein